MPDLTLDQRFGSNVSFDESTKILSINLNDLSDSGDIQNSLGLDVSAITDANKDNYSSKILAALIELNYQQQPESNNDETVLLYISGVRKGSATIRNSATGVSQFPFQKTITVYSPDNLGDNIDPDDLG